MARRFKFKKLTSGEYAECFYCGKKNTHFALYDKKDGSQTWCCVECGLKVGKIKRLKNLLRKYPLRKQSSISKANSLLKMQEKGIGGLI